MSRAQCSTICARVIRDRHRAAGGLDRARGKLFKAAEASDAVLLFDDTAHLFGETLSAQDSGRFPNLDIAQLRQRLEAYDGVVVLGADDRAHIDPKLARQCDEVVDLDSLGESPVRPAMRGRPVLPRM